MQPLIKITSEPMRMVRFSQNARLINADNVDMERRKALARQSSFRSSAGQGTISVEDIKKINRLFSTNSADQQSSQETAQQNIARQGTVQRRQAQPSAPAVPASMPAPEMASAALPAVDLTSGDIPAEAMPDLAVSSATNVQPDISVESSSSYTTQRGSFEMRVAKGELTYIPPLVMTIITQRPTVQVEYLGGFNYIPPRDDGSGDSVNLFT